MKTIPSICIALLLCSGLTAQIDLTTEQWQEDIRFLQQTVHEDYDFLFDKVTAEAFDAKVEALINAVPSLEDHEVIVGLARLVALFKYGHTNLRLAGWNPDNPYGFRQMPYNLYHFSDGIYIQGAHQDYAEAVGAKVTQVAGVPIADALIAIRPVVSAENEQYFKAFGINYLGTPAVLHAQGVTPTLQETIILTLEKDNKTFETTFEPISTEAPPIQYSFLQEADNWVDARDNSSTPLWLKNLDRIYYYEYLPESKTVYVRQSQVQDEEDQPIPAFYEEVFQFVEDHDVERFVLDVRLNGGGNNYKNKPVVTGVIRTDKIDQPGKFFVVLGRRTYSACQNLVNELHTYTNAIFVGEPTSENINFYGDNRVVTLPNSAIKPRLSYAWWQDKPQWENGPWLAPHLPAELSFADYRDNHDPVMDAILNYSGDLAILDPMQHLTDLFLAGKIDEVQSEAHRLVADPKYQHYPFKSQLDRAAHNLLGGEQFQEALFVFGLNAELFPDSPTVWVGLAEGYWKAGDQNKAVTFFEKALAMDPDGPTGVTARKMLAKIQEGK